MQNVELTYKEHVERTQTHMENVGKLMEAFPSTWVDDRVLYVLYLRTYVNRIVDARAILKGPSPETLIRCRRRWNKQGKFIVEDILERRAKRRGMSIRENKTL